MNGKQISFIGILVLVILFPLQAQTPVLAFSVTRTQEMAQEAAAAFLFQEQAAPLHIVSVVEGMPTPSNQAIGLSLGDIHPILDENGEIVSKSKVKTDRGSIKSYFDKIRELGEIKGVVEASFNWSYFFDEVRDNFQELLLSHPKKTRAIAEARIKTDSIDSEVLANLLRADLIPQAYVPSQETREVKNLMAAQNWGAGFGLREFSYQCTVVIDDPGDYEIWANARDVLYFHEPGAHQASEGAGMAVVDVIVGDFNGDGVVDGKDLAAFGSQWLETGPDVTADLDGSGEVNLSDFSLFADEW